MSSSLPSLPPLSSRSSSPWFSGGSWSPKSLKQSLMVALEAIKLEKMRTASCERKTSPMEWSSGPVMKQQRKILDIKTLQNCIWVWSCVWVFWIGRHFYWKCSWLLWQWHDSNSLGTIQHKNTKTMPKLFHMLHVWLTYNLFNNTNGLRSQIWLDLIVHEYMTWIHSCINSIFG